ncbi:hypothetical protein IL306_005659 [Fusarium sp. DS 682]|nr:hypothetical protein IL306_005659 [Fusarium sp. DS 682]
MQPGSRTTEVPTTPGVPTAVTSAETSSVATHTTEHTDLSSADVSATELSLTITESEESTEASSTLNGITTAAVSSTGLSSAEELSTTVTQSGSNTERSVASEDATTIGLSTIRGFSTVDLTSTAAESDTTWIESTPTTTDGTTTEAATTTDSTGTADSTTTKAATTTEPTTTAEDTTTTQPAISDKPTTSAADSTISTDLTTSAVSTTTTETRAAPTRITNGGFEDSALVASSWTRVTPSGSWFVLTIDTTQKHDGQNSALMTWSQGTSGFVRQSLQDIKAGVPYAMSAWVLPSVCTFAYIICYYNTVTVVNRANFPIAGGTGNTWQQVSTTCTYSQDQLDVGGLYLAIGFNCPGAGSKAHIDTVVVSEL